MSTSFDAFRQRRGGGVGGAIAEPIRCESLGERVRGFWKQHSAQGNAPFRAIRVPACSASVSFRTSVSLYCDPIAYAVLVENTTRQYPPRFQLGESFLYSWRPIIIRLSGDGDIPSRWGGSAAHTYVFGCGSGLIR